MKGHDFYKITGPVEWTGPPKWFSYSSLTAIEKCPLQWQLANSKYSHDLSAFPARPAPAVVEGHIVHSILDKLFKALSLVGLPEFGTSEFRECVGNVDIKNTVAMLASEHEEKITKHPRGNGFRLRSTRQQMTNQVIRLFKNQYSRVAPGKAKPIGLTTAAFNAKEHKGDTVNPLRLINIRNALTEFYLKAEDLSFSGIIDLVWKDGDQTVIVDFKTGGKEENHKKQVSYYAALWKKVTGQSPSRVEVRYPGEIVSLAMSEPLLIEVVDELSTRIFKASNSLTNYPAETVCGPHCVCCDVRQFCDHYWQDKNLGQVNNRVEKIILDIELLVSGEPTNYGFEAMANCGEKISIVYDTSVKKVIGPFRKDDQVRVLRGVYNKDPLSIVLESWTEVFFIGC